MNKPHTKLYNLLEGAPSGGGSGGYDFKPDLPEDIRNDPVFEVIKGKTPNEVIGLLGKGYAHAQKLIGTQRLEVPKADWTPEKWAAFNKSLGVPDDHTKYETPKYDFKAKGLTVQQERLDGFKKLFKEIGLRPDQAARLQKAYLEDIDGQVFEGQTKAKTDQEAAILKLKGDFGDKFDAKIDMGKAAIKKFGSEALLQRLSDLGVINDPEVINFIVKVGEQTIEDHGAGDGGGLPVGQAAAALAEINSLKIDEEFQKALTTRMAPSHQAAVDKWLGLHKQAFPGKQAAQE